MQRFRNQHQQLHDNVVFHGDFLFGVLCYGLLNSWRTGRQFDRRTDWVDEWLLAVCLPACLGDCFGWLLLCISIKHSLHYIYNGHKLCSPDAAINRSNGTTPSGTELKGSWGWADKLQWAIRWKREQAWTTVRHAEGVCSRELLDSH